MSALEAGQARAVVARDASAGPDTDWTTSCNLAFRERRGRLEPAPAAGIYDAMAADLERADARFALWIGDQVYADGSASPSVAALLARHAQSIDLLEERVPDYLRCRRAGVGYNCRAHAGRLVGSAPR